MDKNKLAEEYGHANNDSNHVEFYAAKNGFLAGFDAALTELSKSGEFREFWLYQSARDHVTENFKDVEKWKREFVADDLTYQPEIVHVIEIAALQAKNAKIQELEAEFLTAKQRASHFVNCAASDKRGLPNEVNKAGVCVSCGLPHYIKGVVAIDLTEKITELEQQLKKADSVIEFYAKDAFHELEQNSGYCNYLTASDQEDINGNLYGGKRARQYLKSRGA